VTTGGGSSLPLKARCTVHILGGHRNKFVVKFTNASDPAVIMLKGYDTRIVNANGETLDDYHASLTHPRVIKPGEHRVVHFYFKLLGTPTGCQVTNEAT
jgi:hypothetical protein